MSLRRAAPRSARRSPPRRRRRPAGAAGERVAETDTRVLIPRVRRSVEGLGAPEKFPDDDIIFLIADSIADVILYTGGTFPKQLLVTDRDGTTNTPTEYATS